MYFPAREFLQNVRSGLSELERFLASLCVIRVEQPWSDALCVKCFPHPLPRSRTVISIM